MYKEKLRKLIAILDKELSAYEKFKDLLSTKRECLKKAKSGDLGEIDSQILALNEKIVKLNNSRQKLSEDMLGKNCSMSEFISFADENQPEFSEPLKLRRVKICKILDELTLLNSQIVGLLKHGIIITNKMLETIVDAFAPQGSNYNGAGKTDTHDLNMWTVNEEI